MRKMIFILVALFAVSVAAFATSSLLSDKVSVRLGHYDFAIPKKYSRQGSIPSWLAGIPGLDNGSRAYLLEFPAEDIAKAVPGYQTTDGKYSADVEAILNVLEPYEVARYKDSGRNRDLWERIGKYKDQIIEPYRDSNWYIVYPRLDRSFGTVVRLAPNLNDAMPEDPLDFYVARCRKGNSPITLTGKFESCVTYAYYDDIAIEFYIYGPNLHLVDNVRSYLKTKIESWKVRQ